jgi:hypothetical protein
MVGARADQINTLARIRTEISKLIAQSLLTQPLGTVPITIPLRNNIATVGILGLTP